MKDLITQNGARECVAAQSICIRACKERYIKVTTVTNLKLQGNKLIDTEMVGQIKSPEWSMNSTTLALS